MNREQTNDAETVALRALGWALSDEARAGRFLALTGLTPEMLRARIHDPLLLAAGIRFLEAHEPDLIACAEFLELEPLQLIEARSFLDHPSNGG